MANTPNFALYKPSRADSGVEVDVSLTDNFVKIDTELKTNKDNLDTHKADVNAHASDKITHADGSVKTTLDNHEERLTSGEVAQADHETRISSNETSVADHETRLTGVEGKADDIDNRVTDIETLGLDILAPNLEGRLATVESDVEGFLAPATFDAMDSQSYTFDEYRIGYVDNKLAQFVKNFKEFYLTSDGTNYSPTLQRALDYCKSQYALGNVITLFVPKGEYQLVTGVSIDGYTSVDIPKTIFHLKMDGYFTATNGIGKMLTIKNCTGCELDIKAKGLNHLTTNLVYSTDWSENVVGLDVALYLESCSYIKLDFYGKRFFGRGIETKDCNTNSWGTIRGDLIGQMMYIRGTSGFGNVGNIWATEYMGSYFKVTDITIPYYENMILDTSVKKGIVFDGCVSLWIDVMNVGNNSNDYEVHLLSCNNINISSMYIYGHSQTVGTDYCAGLHVYQSYNLNINLNTAYIKGNALFIEGIKASTIKLIDSYSDNIGTITTTSSYGVANTTIDVYSRYRKGTGLIAQKGASGQAIDSLAISINAKDRDAANTDAVDLKVVDSDSKVIILPSTNASTIDIPVTNVVKDVYSTTSSFTNPVKYTTYSQIVTPTTSLSGYALSGSLNNKVSRQGNNAVGTISITNATNNGNLAVNDILALYDKKLAPSTPVFIPLMCRLADGTIKIIDATLEWDTTGTRLKIQSAIATSNVSRITANFAYECEL